MTALSKREGEFALGLPFYMLLYFFSVESSIVTPKCLKTSAFMPYPCDINVTLMIQIINFPQTTHMHLPFNSCACIVDMASKERKLLRCLQNQYKSAFG
jgi:hypothetical protein